MADVTNFNLSTNDEEEEFAVEFGEVINIREGTSNFNELTNRPSYAGQTMTGDTNIPEVPVSTSELTNDSGFQTGDEVSAAINTAVGNEADTRAAADNNLQGQIDAISASSDVTDIVGTYAELQSYDTSTLKDNDIVKVLQDENHSDETTYYRWSTSTETFTLIGEEGPYYTKSQTDTLLGDKQDLLTAGSNISIQETSSGNVISATDTTYSPFVGTDGQTSGSAGLVPAPATTDDGKFLKADGTWDTAGSPITVVQTTGTSPTDVMSQSATTGMVFTDPSSKEQLRIGGGNVRATSYGVALGYDAHAQGLNSTAIGHSAASSSASSIAVGNSAIASGSHSIAIGTSALANVNRAIAIGAFASASQAGEINVGSGVQNLGYNNTNYRLLTGLYDPQSAHDAATKGYVDGLVGNIETALNAINNGTGA